MGYYGGYRRRSYRSWRSRGYGRGREPSAYSRLYETFGSAANKIQTAFLNLDEDALASLLEDYGSIHGDAAESYARKTYPSWKSGKTNLSGQTLTRLVELVPPYLSPAQRIELVEVLVQKHKPRGQSIYKRIEIDVTQPHAGFAEIDKALAEMEVTDVLAHLPESVMEAAKWLYDDDVTAARSVLAAATRTENENKKRHARKELELLKRTVSTGQVKTANYSVTLPAGELTVRAFTPSKGIFETIRSWFS